MAKPAIRKLKPEIREIVEWAQKYGWTFDGECDGQEHWILRHGDDCVRLPATPSDTRRVADNIKAKIRRISGIPNDSGPAGKYRHEPRKPRNERFDIAAARREQRRAEFYGITGGYTSKREDDDAERRREEALGRLAERAEREEALDRLRADHKAALAQLRAVNPRRNPALARQIARKVTDLQEQLKGGS